MLIYIIMSVANAYLSYSAKPTFGSTQQIAYSNYQTISVNNKSMTICLPTPVYLIQNGNLNINLITSLDLTNVDVLKQSNSNTITTIDPNKNFYSTYTIDPNGDLFGKNICGINSYQNYLVYTKPTINTAWK